MPQLLSLCHRCLKRALSAQPHPSHNGRRKHPSPPHIAAVTAFAAFPRAPTAADDAPKKAGKPGKDQAAAAKPAAASATAFTEVAPRVEELLATAVAALLGCASADEAVAGGKLEGYALSRLRADIAMQLSGLKNAAYAAGYVAGKGEMVAHAEKRYA